MILDYLKSLPQRLHGTRRDLMKAFPPAAALFPCAVPSAPAAQQSSGENGIYGAIGVRALINARGTVTIVGASRTLPEVKAAMEQASRHNVQIDELMASVGRRLAELTGAEWGAVTAGASAALTVATAACITGGDPDRMVQLPNLRGMKDEVVMPSYSRTAYDAAARAVGARVVEVRSNDELRSALGPRTAMVMILAGAASESGPLSTSGISALAKPMGVPILVDAAAEELLNPNPHLAQGADLVAYSGGKCLRGPQCAGLLLGRRGLVEAAWAHHAPHHGFGRGMKIGREEIMGMLAAVEAWRRRDHEGEQRMWISWLEYISQQLRPVRGVKTEILPPRGRSNRTPSLRISWDAARIPLAGHEMEKILWDGSPRIAVSGAGSYLPFPPNMQPDITLVPYQLEEGEQKLIARRLVEVFAQPHRKKPQPPAAVNVSGQWDLDLKFAAGLAQHTLSIEQDGDKLAGTHYGSFAKRDVAGELHGNEILLRSSYTRDGVRLNFEFTGVVRGGAMEGRVSLGEYGTAEWRASRRAYPPFR